ncbi:MAG TPA: hypothetical protein VKS79_01625 [Gemmataceae bacterium]|nr:hypothetical protein [Gemmataceae bacterium]
MPRFVLPTILALTIIPMLRADERDPLKERKERWQQVLDRDPFRFSEERSGVVYSLSQYGGKCDIHIVRKAGVTFQLTFQFVRDGKELLALQGHTYSEFRTDKNVLYFAQFPPGDCGCTVSAYDLDTGKKLWSTALNAVGRVAHSAYQNQVMMGLGQLHMEPDGVVSITGKESYGDYLEILDRKTGAILAHKVYRQGYGK